MKPERVIIIKNPRLKRIRSNLRKLWLEAALDGALKGKNENDLNIIRDSICQCASGGRCLNSELVVERFDSTDLDMGYVSFREAWYCIDCFNWIKENEEELKKALNIFCIDPAYES